ncbi:hypothetical protein THAOC_05793, partial [Thalassiosira oceanica]
FEPLLSAEPRPKDRSEHVKGLCLGDGRRRRGQSSQGGESLYMFTCSSATCLVCVWLVLASAARPAAWRYPGGRPARGPEARGPELRKVSLSLLVRRPRSKFSVSSRPHSATTKLQVPQAATSSKQRRFGRFSTWNWRPREHAAAVLAPRRSVTCYVPSTHRRRPRTTHLPVGVDKTHLQRNWIERRDFSPSHWTMAENVESAAAAAAIVTEVTGSTSLEDNDETSSEQYHYICQLLARTEKLVGADWDGLTVLEDNKGKTTVVMPDYITRAVGTGDIKSVLRWINANRSENRANAVSSAEMMGIPALILACMNSEESHLTLITLLLQLGSDVNTRASNGGSAISIRISTCDRTRAMREGVRLLLSWGASFFPEDGRSRESCIYRATKRYLNDIASLLESELGGRRCEIFNLTSKPELNGKTCVADEYLPTSNQYKVTLETKSKEVLVLSPDNLKRRDRTPQDCGYYVEFKNGRTVRHDFDSSEDCRAFVAALHRGEAQEVVTEEAEARAEQAAAELLSELGLDDSPKNRGNGVKKSKKKKGSKKKKK